MLLSRSRSGACQALTWDDTQNRYLCGALAQPERWLPLLPAPWARALTRRWIAAAQGCDAALEAAPLN
jgi:hypothetical protein